MKLFLPTILLITILTLSHCHNTVATAEQDLNCLTSFSVLEESLLSRESNRFNLLRMFYPPRGPLPVFLAVTYRFDGLENRSNESIWYWSESEIYFIQPLDVLQFTSLFHSNFHYRTGELDLVLDGDCFSAGMEFMEMLTQRLKLYAQTSRVSTSSDPLRISDLYLAVAASHEEIISDSLQSLFVRIWLHIVFFLFPIATVVVVYMCNPIQLLLGDKTWQKLRDESNYPRLAAMIQLSVVFTVYVFIIDCFSFSSTLKSELYSNPTHSGFYITTVTSFVIDVAAFLWVVFILVTSCHWDCRNIFRGNFCEPITTKRIHTLLIYVTVSPLLCSANHLPYIILSYASDPYHAGSISMGYFMTFLLFYFIFSQFYSRFALRTAYRPKEFPHAANTDIVHYPDGDVCRRKVRVPFNTQVVMLSLVIVTPLLLLYEALIIVLFWALPITKTVEDSPTRLYTIYQGTGILIVALLTYSIVLRPSPFSIAGMLDKLGKQLHIPEDLQRKWIRMGDEEKAATVIRTLFSHKELVGVADKTGAPPTLEASGATTNTTNASITSLTAMMTSSSNEESPEVGRANYCHGYTTIRLEAVNSIDESEVIDRSETTGNKESSL